MKTEPLLPCGCGQSNLSRSWHSVRQIRVECIACGEKGPLSNEKTMHEAKEKAHALWNQERAKL